MSLERWMYKLGSLHQFHGVEYVCKDGDSTKCLLCETGWMIGRGRNRHFHGSQHTKKYNRVKALEAEHAGRKAQLNRERVRAQANSDRIDLTKKLDIRVQQLGLELWQIHMQSHMWKYCLTGHDYDRMVAKLQHYERMEATSLLELAIWKAKLIGNGLVFEDMTQVREYQVLDEDFDSRAFMEDLRISSGAAVTIPLVMECVGP